MTDKDIKTVLKACETATQIAIKAGHEVLFVEDNKLIRLKTNGTLEFIKDMPPRVSFEEHLKLKSRITRGEIIS